LAIIRKARLRRRSTLETIADRAGITRKTLYRVERGDPAVAFGIYARVLQALRLENDIALIAADDVLGRKLQDLGLEPKSRAPRRRVSPDPGKDDAERRGSKAGLRKPGTKTR